MLKNQQLSTPLKGSSFNTDTVSSMNEMKLFNSSKASAKSEVDIYGFNFITLCQNDDDGWMYKVVYPTGEQLVKNLLEVCNTKDEYNSDHQHIVAN